MTKLTDYDSNSQNAGIKSKKIKPKQVFDS